jgi:signal transduction histidine kinase
MRHRLTGLHKNGTRIPISLSGSIIYNEDGDEVATVGIFTDLRQIRDMERELEKKERELIESDRLASLGKLAAGVAHEINNPLTGILTFAEDLLEDSEEEDPRREDYKVIHHEALRCREIVKGLLDFARQDKITQQPLHINPIVMQNFSLVKRLASFQNIEITHDLADDLPVVVGDPTQLQQVFLNMMVNASEAMPQGGELYIATRLTLENMVDISFSDTGDGISPEILKNIFEPFFSTKGGKTSGLGLAVSWGIIQQHGGQIDVETALGQGTRFHILLPAERK